MLVDGYGVGDVGSVVLRDRKHLAEDGMIVVVVTMSGEDGSVVSGPDIITRGFVYVKESEELMDELRGIACQTLYSVRAAPPHRLGHYQERGQGRPVLLPL